MTDGESGARINPIAAEAVAVAAQSLFKPKRLLLVLAGYDPLSLSCARGASPSVPPRPPAKADEPARPAATSP